MVAIVVPTYREAENIEYLLARVDAAMSAADMEYSVLVVDDDSDDGIEAKVDGLDSRYPVRCHVRKGEVRDLSWSVLDGIRLVTDDVVVVMDADLSHPPEAIPTMVQGLADPDVDMVLGSRYVSGGSFDRDWDFWRFLNSHVATLLVKPLVDCSDPMSGFFAAKRAALGEIGDFNPIGYKIALELIVRGRLRISEAPIRFKDREKGESKMNLRQQFNYLRHLRRLYLHRFPAPAEVFHFLTVGGSGFVIDVACYYLLQAFGLEHRLARAISFWPAVTWNWFLNRQMTFSERKKRPKLRQWFEFSMSCLIGFSINWGTYAALTTYVAFFDDYRLLTILLGAALGFVFNFTMASVVVYNERRSH